MTEPGDCFGNVYDKVAQVACDTYATLSKVGKPIVRSNGIPEWTILAGIVVQCQDLSLHCLSLATGVKCLPHSKVLLANGLALHDSHAEILAIRGFNRFLLDELGRIDNDEDYESSWLKKDTVEYPYRFTGSDIYLFVSGTPCGDASLDLLAEDPNNAVPWTLPEGSSQPEIIRGHEYVWQHGKVRFKPGRGDSPQTLSKSCSDKLALISCTSLLNSYLSSIINPSSCYISSLITPTSSFHDIGFHRAFHQRLSLVKDHNWGHGFSFQPFQIATTNFSIPEPLLPPKGANSKSSASSPTSVIYVSGRSTEVLLGGVKIGSSFPPPSVRTASSLCRANMASDFIKLISRHQEWFQDLQLDELRTYGQIKGWAGKRKDIVKMSVREVLGTWRKNDGDENFTLQLLR